MNERISGAAMVHLEKELEPVLARALFDPINLPKVREFAKSLVGHVLLAEMNVGGRTYNIFDFRPYDGMSEPCQSMAYRVNLINVGLGKDDCRHILEHQGDIPKEFRGGVVFFIFTNWHHSSRHSEVAYIYWDDDCWAHGWHWCGRDILSGRVLRRKPASEQVSADK